MMRTITKGIQTCLPCKRSTGTLKLKECQHCSKDPMRDIWQLYLAFFGQRSTLFLPVDTAINYSPQVSRHMWIWCNQKSILVLKLKNFLSPCILENHHVLVWPANQEITEFGWKFSCKPSRSVWYLFGITSNLKDRFCFVIDKFLALVHTLELLACSWHELSQMLCSCYTVEKFPPKPW